MTHHPKSAPPLRNHSDVDDDPPIFSVSLILYPDNNLVPDIKPSKIRCGYKDDLTCLIQSADYGGPIWITCTHEGGFYRWCRYLHGDVGGEQVVSWRVPWDNTKYQIFFMEPDQAGGPTGTLVVGTQGGDGDRSGRCP